MAASHRRLDSRRAAALSAAALLAPLALAACGRHETAASRSAAAYDEAQGKGTPVEKGGAHGGHAAPTAEKQAQAAPADPHAQHPVPAASASAKAGAGAHEQHAVTGVQPSKPAPMDHAAMGHGAQVPPPSADHAAMGHGAPVPSPVPEPAAAAAQPGQPAATLRADDLDAPAPTSMRDAERAAALAKEMAGGHGMQHGTPYKQLDAGRDSEPSHHQHEAVPAPKPAAEDPHRGHSLPAPAAGSTPPKAPKPRPSPSPTPTPKPSPHRHEGF